MSYFYGLLSMVGICCLAVGTGCGYLLGSGKKSKEKKKPKKVNAGGINEKRKEAN